MTFIIFSPLFFAKILLYLMLAGGVDIFRGREGGIVTLHQLRIFAAIAKHLNITKASEELRMGQSSVSEQMKLLEEESGAPLYKKSRCGIELTDQGRLFLSEAEAILADVESLRKQFGAEAMRSHAASVTIGAAHSPSASFLPVVAAVFKETRPRVMLVLRTDTSHEIIGLLLNSEIEIGVVTNPPNDSSIIVEPYRCETLAAFVSAKHPLAKKGNLTVADVANTPLVLKSGGSRFAQFKQELQNRGFEPNVVMRCESPEAVKVAVRAGMGLGLLYEPVVARDVKRGELKVLKIPELKITAKTSVIYHKERRLSPDAQDFLALLRKWPKRKGAWSS